jgi:hypothetical protein
VGPTGFRRCLVHLGDEIHAWSKIPGLNRCGITGLLKLPRDPFRQSAIRRGLAVDKPLALAVLLPYALSSTAEGK